MSRLALLLTLCLPAFAAAQSLPAVLVARTGQDAPGIPGATFTTIGTAPHLGAGGHVAFSSSIAGATTFDDFAFWVGTPGDLQLAAREDTANSGPETFGIPNVDANGTISIWEALAFPVPNNQRQVLASYLPAGNGGNNLVARQGITQPPGFAAGATFAAIGSGHAANDAGAVAFIGTAAGGDATSMSDQALWAGTPGDLKLVAREGSPATGATGSATVFSTTTTPFYGKAINASGQVAFGASLSGPGIGVANGNDRAIYVWSPAGTGSLDLAAQTGNVAPDTSPTIKFSTIDDIPAFNNAGQVAFRGTLISDVPGEVNLINSYGVWAGAPGSVHLVYRANDPTPIAGTQFRTSPPYPRIGNNGDVAFKTVIVGAGVVSNVNDQVLWLKSDAGIEKVAREGDAAPGAPAGVNFDVIDATFAVNGLGQVAFGSTLTGTGVVPANDRGLWAGAPGDVQLIAREGDVIDLDPTAGELLKTIQSISFANGLGTTINESASAAFNDAGQIAWRAQFTDSTTAVFLTTLPGAEPGPAADFDVDGDVDGFDLAAWSAHFGLSGNATHAEGDADMDQDVDGADFLLWQQQEGITPVAAVPEPISAALMLCILFAATKQSVSARTHHHDKARRAC